MTRFPDGDRVFAVSWGTRRAGVSIGAYAEGPRFPYASHGLPGHAQHKGGAPDLDPGPRPVNATDVYDVPATRALTFSCRPRR
jgi:hypothetical protein